MKRFLQVIGIAFTGALLMLGLELAVVAYEILYLADRMPLLMFTIGCQGVATGVAITFFVTGIVRLALQKDPV